MCKLCKSYENKVLTIDQAMMRISKKTDDKIGESEKKEFKKRLTQSF
jgi:hypothetical protein